MSIPSQFEIRPAHLPPLPGAIHGGDSSTAPMEIDSLATISSAVGLAASGILFKIPLDQARWMKMASPLMDDIDSPGLPQKTPCELKGGERCYLFLPQNARLGAKEFTKKAAQIFSRWVGGLPFEERVSSQDLKSLHHGSRLLNEEELAKRALIALAESPSLQKADMLFVLTADPAIQQKLHFPGEKERIEWLERAAEAGDLPSRLELVDHLERAAEPGDLPSMHKLLKHCKSIDQASKDPKQSAYYSKKVEHWQERAATAGDLNAQYAMGTSIFNTPDVREKWLKRAIEGGHEAAAEELAKLYEEDGDYEKALPLYEKAANQGNRVSQVKLAEFYYKNSPLIGRGLSESEHWQKALGLLKLVAESRDEDGFGDWMWGGSLHRLNNLIALAYIERRHGELISDEEADQNAILWLTKELDTNPEAYSLLGNLSLKKKDFHQAVSWYQKGIDMDTYGEDYDNFVSYGKCYKNLAECYKNGLGVTQDIPKAAEYYSLSVRRFEELWYGENELVDQCIIELNNLKINYPKHFRAVLLISFKLDDDRIELLSTFFNDCLDDAFHGHLIRRALKILLNYVAQGVFPKADEILKGYIQDIRREFLTPPLYRTLNKERKELYIDILKQTAQESVGEMKELAARVLQEIPAP